MARKAFVIASNGPEGIGRLNYAEKDADDISKCLAGYRYGFEIIRPEKDSDKYAIWKKLEETIWACEAADDFILYFSGHGHLPNGQLALVIDNKELRASSLDFSIIYKCFREQCKAQNKLIILDCCHAGAADSLKSVPNQAVRDVTPILETDNHLVLVASERLSTIREYPDLKGSFLTQKLCTALDNEFDNVDKDKDQEISIKDLLDWLKNSRSIFNLDKEEDKQAPLPYLFGQQRGSEFLLTQKSKKWSPQELVCLDGSKLIILPVKPREGLALYFGKYLVTNAQYRKFVQETGRDIPSGRYLPYNCIKDNQPANWKAGFHSWHNDQFNDPNQPVVCISYYDAINYCKWVQSKLVKSSKVKAFIPPDKLWNFAAYGMNFITDSYRHSKNWFKKTFHHKSTSPAVIDQTESRSNVYGISDMFGNVWEWSFGEIRVNMSIGNMYQNNPVIKGGGFLDDLSSDYFTPHIETYLLVQHGSNDLKDECRKFTSFDLGFRIAGTIPVDILSEEQQLRLSLCSPLDNSYWYSIIHYEKFVNIHN